MGVGGLVREVVSLPAALAKPVGGLVVDAGRAAAQRVLPSRDRPDVDRTGTDLAHRRRRLWVGDGHAWIELREVDEDRAAGYLAAISQHLSAHPAVIEVRLHPAAGRALVVFDPHETSSDDLVGLVDEVELELHLTDAAFGRHRPPHPSDLEPVVEGIVAVGADAAGLGLAGLSRALRLPSLPFEVDAAALLTIASYVPWVRDWIERNTESPAVGTGLAVARAITGGINQSIGGPLIDMVHRGSLVAGAEARRRAWDRLEPELATWHDGDAASPLIPGARPGVLPRGPIERFALPTTVASAGAAGLGLLVRPNLDRAVSFLVAGTPKAATWGREAYAAHLGVHLAARDLLLLDPEALERLDRIDTLVVTGDLLLQRLGTRWEPAGFAPELIAAARDAGVDVWVATDDPSSADHLEVRGTVADGAESADAVRRMQADGRGVAVIAAGMHPALPLADVGLGLRASDRGIAWGASMVGGEGLVDGHLLMLAVGAAKDASRQAAHIAMAGAGVAGLMAFGGVIPGNLNRVMGAVNLAALVSHANGARVATDLARQRLPEPRDLTPFHAMSAEEVLAVLDTGPSGLGADDVAARTEPPLRRPPASVALLRAMGDELVNPLTPFLAAGAGLSAAAGSVSDALLVGGVLGLNAAIGGTQRFRAARATEALLRREQSEVTVMRGGQPASIPSDALVVGDVVTLLAGDVVPADCRILEAQAVEVDESSLTGESLPVDKDGAPTGIDVAVADRRSMLFAGTIVAAGSATAVVVATGRHTEAYRGLLLVGRGPEASGVEARLESLTTMVTPLSVLAGLGVLGSGVARGRPMTEVLSSGVSLSVAAVPEGLPLLATAAQQAAARRLSKRGVIVRNARAIEALGRIDVLCADKTGTLTLGRIRVSSVGDGSETQTPAETSGLRRRVLAAARAATPDDEGGRRLPHPTDRAILYATEEAGLHRHDELGGWEKLAELPFEPRRGYHATLGRTGAGRLVYLKGAPEVILDRCRYRLAADGRRIKATDARRRAWADRVEALAARGLRILVVAERPVAAGEGFDDHIVDDLTFLGLLGLEDPVRETSAKAIDDLRRAGVRTIMITGDHPTTARGIGAVLGLDGADVLTGPDIDRLSDEALAERLGSVAVCARVTPAHKVRIVRALQGAGRTVAMTGDGANDAPAIRLADVGVALGTRATDAARDASDLVVTDDRIETIVAAVVEGRALWASVRDATAILVGGNLGEIAFTLAGSILTGTSPINTRQLLLVNLMTDVLPAMAIAVSPPTDTDPDDLLAEGPEASLGDALNRAIIERAAVTTVGTTAGWAAARVTGRRRRASTVALASLVGTELGQTLTTGWRSPLVVASSLGSMGALVGIIQTPGLSHLFGCTPLGPLGWTQAATSATAATLGGRFVPAAIDRVASAIRR